MPINKNEITKEMLEKALQCETVEDLLALAKLQLQTANCQKSKNSAVKGILQINLSNKLILHTETIALMLVQY